MSSIDVGAQPDAKHCTTVPQSDTLVGSRLSDLWHFFDCMSASDQRVVNEALHSQRAPLEIDVFK